MKPEDVPTELVEMMNEAAGKEHSADGSVLTTVARILTRYDELRASARLPPMTEQGERGRVLWRGSLGDFVAKFADDGNPYAKWGVGLDDTVDVAVRFAKKPERTYSPS